MHWTGKVERIAFTLFGKFDVAWYGIIITCAMLIGLAVAVVLAKRMNVTSDDLLELFLIAIPLAVVGARLGFVFAHFERFFLVDNFTWDSFVDIIAIWDGGLTIMTGAPAGILGGLIWCKWRKVSFWKLADTVICVLLLSQALGRWGNFCNQELYGLAVENPSLQFFPYAVYIASEGGFYQATFFYEFIADLIGFGLMLYLSKHLYMTGSGIVQYGFFYYTIRFIMEFFRDSTDILGIPNTNRLFCGIAALACLAVLVTMAVSKIKAGQIIWFKKGIPAELYAHSGPVKKPQPQTKTK